MRQQGSDLFVFRKPPAMPVEASRERALASSIERSELLSKQGHYWQKLEWKGFCPFTGGGAVDASGK